MSSFREKLLARNQKQSRQIMLMLGDGPRPDGWEVLSPIVHPDVEAWFSQMSTTRLHPWDRKDPGGVEHLSTLYSLMMFAHEVRNLEIDRKIVFDSVAVWDGTSEIVPHGGKVVSTVDYHRREMMFAIEPTFINGPSHPMGILLQTIRVMPMFSQDDYRVAQPSLGSVLHMGACALGIEVEPL